jgi:hypothetical protein
MVMRRWRFSAMSLRPHGGFAHELARVAALEVELLQPLFVVREVEHGLHEAVQARELLGDERRRFLHVRGNGAERSARNHFVEPGDDGEGRAQLVTRESDEVALGLVQTFQVLHVGGERLTHVREVASEECHFVGAALVDGEVVLALGQRDGGLHDA